MKRMLLFLLMLLPVSVVFGQTYWERLPAPNGAIEVNCFTEDVANSRFYAGCVLGRGIYTSSDNGASWSLKANGLPVNCDVRDLGVDNSGAVYATINSEASKKVYKSADFGDSWTELFSSPESGTSFFVTANGTLIVYSDAQTGGSGVHQSTDGGATWTKISEGLPSYDVFIFTYYYPITGFTEDNSGNLYASVRSNNNESSGVYKSTDGGATWTRSSEGMLADRNTYGVVTGADGLYAGVKNRVYKSTDGGATWANTDSLPMSPSTNILKLACNATGEVFASTTSGTFKAGTGGSGWASINNFFSYAKDFDILNDGSFVSCGLGNGLDGGMYRSTDAGATWELMNNGINNTVTYALEATPDGRILNGVIGHVDVSSDNGLTFDRVELPIGNIIRDINSNASGAIVACSRDGIATSQDGGATWTQTHAGDFYCFTTNADGSFLASGTVGLSPEIFKSTDNGQTWSVYGNVGGSARALFETSTGTVLAGNYNSGIFRSTDDGATWTKTYDVNITVLDFAEAADGTIYTITLLGLLKSTDGGATWEDVNTGIFHQYSALIIKGGSMFLGTSDGLYLSTDNAASWTSHKEGLLYTYLAYLTLANDGYLYGAGGAGIYKSSQAVVTGIGDFAGELPEGFALAQNYPNPFNPNTTITFNLPQNGRSGLGLVELKIFDLLGKEVKTLISQPMAAGFHSVQWDGNNNAGQPVASGVYLYRLSAGELVSTQKMMLLR